MVTSYAGSYDLRAEEVDAVVKNYAMENFTMLQVCSIVPTSSWINTYYQETDAINTKVATTAITGTSFGGVPEGAEFPYIQHSWTKTQERVSKHAGKTVLTWEVKNTSSFDILARSLERVGQAIAHSLDTAIITELATTTNTAAAVATWDNATESLQQPLKDILKGIAAMASYNRNAYTGGYIIMHPNNFMELMNNPVCRNAGQFYSADITRNGRVGQIAGQTIIVNNASTENVVLMCIGKQAMAYYEAAPLQTNVVERAGIDYTVSGWLVGVPVLIDNYSAYKITGC